MAVAMIGPKFYAWDRNGKPLAFGKLYTYEARTNNPKPTYQSEDQIVENTNPVILNGEGYANVYLSGRYKMVLKDCKDNEIWSSDPVSSIAAEEWVNCATASYLSPSSFKLVGNFTDSYTNGKKVRLDSNATEYDISTIISSSYAAGETTVTTLDPVVKTGLVQTCVSIIGIDSSPDKKLDFNTVDEMIGYSLISEGDQLRTLRYNSDVKSDWVAVSTLDSGDFGVALDNGLFAKLVSSLTLRAIGCFADGTNEQVNTSLINQVVGNGRVITVDEDSVFLFKEIAAKSNTAFHGVDNFTSILRQVQPEATEATGFQHEGGLLEDVEFYNLTLDGARIANPTSLSTAIIDLRLVDGSGVKNFTLFKCRVINAQEDFARIIGLHENTHVDGVVVSMCEFETEEDKIDLPGNSLIYGTNALRVWGRYQDGDGGDFFAYGQYRYKNISFTNNKCKKMRTASDLKRGVYNSVVSGNITEDCYDVHHSADGVMGVDYVGNSGMVSAGETRGQRPNFYELQGEDITVTGGTFNGNGAVTHGCQITDYGVPEELGVGHNSKNVSVYGFNCKGVTGSPVKITNGVGCTATVSASEFGSHLVLVDSGGGRTDGAEPLTATGNKVIDCTNTSDAGLGVKVQGKNNYVSNNTNAEGVDDHYIPSEVFRDEEEYLGFRTASNVNLNPNENLELVSGGLPNNLKYWTNIVPAVESPTKPESEVYAITLEDDSITSLREAVLTKNINIKKGENLFVRLFAKQGTATQASAIMQEKDSLGVTVSTTFIPIVIDSEWTEQQAKFTVKDESTEYVIVKLSPAAFSNEPTRTGTTHFSNVRISKSPIGVG